MDGLKHIINSKQLQVDPYAHGRKNLILGHPVFELPASLSFRLPKTLSSFTESVTSTLKGTLRKKKDAAAHGSKGLSIMNTVSEAAYEGATDKMSWQGNVGGGS